jgi:hypothetical protein
MSNAVRRLQWMRRRRHALHPFGHPWTTSPAAEGQSALRPASKSRCPRPAFAVFAAALDAKNGEVNFLRVSPCVPVPVVFVHALCAYRISLQILLFLYQL